MSESTRTLGDGTLSSRGSVSESAGGESDRGLANRAYIMLGIFCGYSACLSLIDPDCTPFSKFPHALFAYNVECEMCLIPVKSYVQLITFSYLCSQWTTDLALSLANAIFFLASWPIYSVEYTMNDNANKNIDISDHIKEFRIWLWRKEVAYLHMRPAIVYL